MSEAALSIPNSIPSATRRVRGSARIRAIALYLPQFHPIPENDEWWGRGFTEWTNVARARPLFPGHYQPHLPGELGFYDLRLEETLHNQAALARQHGIEAFCFWHYWFQGRRMLERVVDRMIGSRTPEFPFCLAWANETWGGRWAGARQPVLIEQSYGGDDDHRRHFDALLPAFHDHRYVRVDDKPLFYLYRPGQIPDLERFADLWRNLAQAGGLPGLFLVGQTTGAETDWRRSGTTLDAAVTFNITPKRLRRLRERRRSWDWRLSALSERLPWLPNVYRYASWSPYMPFLTESPGLSFPSVVPGWDNTPRMGRQGYVLHGATPARFRAQVDKAVELVSSRAPDYRIVFVRSWNEWAEGNHMEPDRRYGRGFLEAFRDTVTVAVDMGAFSERSYR